MTMMLAARPLGTPRQDRQQFWILMLASLRGYKGINEFMALAEELQKRTDIWFDLVLNAEADDVAAFARRHSDAANVSIHPSTDDPAQFYSDADLVLNLSRVSPKSLPVDNPIHLFCQPNGALPGTFEGH